MAESVPLLCNFNAGELSPKIDVRSDLARYFNGCRKLENMVPMPGGGVTRRPGIYFVAEGKHADKKVRLITFDFSTIQNYILEMGDKYIRFYKDNGQIVVAFATWVTATAYVVGDRVRVLGSNYRCIVAHTAGTFATDLAAFNWVLLGTGTTAYSAWLTSTAYLVGDLVSVAGPLYYRCLIDHTSGTFSTDLAALKWEVTVVTDIVYEIPTPYLEADLFELKLCQSADTMYISHPTYAPRTLTRTGHTAWVLATFSATGGRTGSVIAATSANPCVITLLPETNMKDWENGQSVRLDAVLGMIELNGNTYTIAGIDKIGKTFQLSGINSSGYTAYATGGFALVTTTMFNAAGDYPACNAIYQQRLFWFATDNNPQTCYGSKSAEYDNYVTGSLDDDGIEYTIGSDKVDRIRWALASDKGLILGTVGGIAVLAPSSASEALAPLNVSTEKPASVGSIDLDAELVNDSIMYVQKGGRAVRAINYNFEKDKLIPEDMTLAADHIAKGTSFATSGIVDIAYQQDPLSILWCVRADGQLLGFLYEPAQKITSWFRFVLTDGEFESIAVLSNEGTEDQNWVSAHFTVDSSEVRMIGYSMPYEWWGDLADYFGVDFGLTYDGGAAVEVTVITRDATCTATIPGHTFIVGNKLKFANTGMWLDDNIVYVHAVNGNDVDLYDEGNTIPIDSTAFPSYPPTATTTTYNGTAQNIIAATKTNPVKVVVPTHGLIDGDLVRIASATGMTTLNDDWVVASATPDTFTVALNGTGLPAYVGSGTVTKGSTSVAGNGTAQLVAKVMSGLGHLEGETVAVNADGATHPDCVVASEAITLDRYANKVHIGRPYTATVSPMKLEGQSSKGTTRGKTKRVTDATLVFHETYGAKWGPDEDTLKTIPFGTGEEPVFFTGEKNSFPFPGDVKSEATIYIVQDLPFPMTLLGIIPNLVVDE
jgi:hypothetical protein